MASFPLFDATLVPLAGENREKAEPGALWRRSLNTLARNNESLAPRDQVLTQEFSLIPFRHRRAALARGARIARVVAEPAQPPVPKRPANAKRRAARSRARCY